MVIMEKDTDVEVGFAVVIWETGKGRSGGDEGVDRLMVRRVFRLVVRGVSLSKLGKSGV